ncbi:MAG: elongation factor Ts [Gammaproteobacteria bacterium]|nr:elongation factor Ts [Gammaproteobacteria bacterium]
MEITAALVKELRERSGAGMMECKNALKETSGDLEAAFEHLRKTGAAKAAKKAGRIAAEGIIAVRASDDGKKTVIVEINSETDFVAKHEDFAAFADGVVTTILANAPADVEALSSMTLAGRSDPVETVRAHLVAKIGENIAVRRFEIMENPGSVGAYLHGTRIGVLVGMTGGDETLARDIAMHIAASRPLCVRENEIPASTLDKEREIFRAQAAESGKPADIIEKMVNGRVQKYVKEVTLLGQPFVKNPDQTVADLLKQAKADVTQFIRFEVGEGIEKKQDDFAEEVRAQAAAANK